MHYQILVIGNGVDDRLEPYGAEYEVEPRKVYLEEYEIEKIKKEYNVSTDKEIAEKIPVWFGQEGGMDKGGFYKIDAFNENSKWDWYQKGGRWHGSLIVKDGKKGERYNTGLDKYKYKKNEYDSALKGDIDWEKTRNDNVLPEKDLRIKWEKMTKFAAPVYRKICKKLYKNLDGFIKAHKVFYVHDVLNLDNEWEEIGDDEESMRNYEEEFIEPLDDNTRLTIVDCHN